MILNRNQQKGTIDELHGESKKAKEFDIKKELRERAQDSLFEVIENNKGKAFTAEALYKRCIEPFHLGVSLTETQQLLNDLQLLGKIRSENKDNKIYYFK